MCVPHFYLLFGLLCVRPLIDTMSCNGTGLSSVLNLSGSWKIIEIRSRSNKGGTENDPWFNLGHAWELVVRTPVGNCLLLSPRNEMDTKEQNCWCWCSWGVTHLGGINIQYIKLMLKMTYSVGAVWFGALKEKTYRYCNKEKRIMRGQLPSSIGSSHLFVLIIAHQITSFSLHRFIFILIITSFFRSEDYLRVDGLHSDLISNELEAHRCMLCTSID